MKKILAVFVLSLLVIGCGQEEEVEDIVVIEPEYTDHEEVVIDEDFLEEDDLVMEESEEITDEVEAVAETITEITSKKIEGRTLRIVEEEDKSEMQVRFSDEVMADDVLVSVPFNKNSDRNFKLDFSNKDYAIVRYDIAGTEGSIFVNLWTFDAIQVDFADFLISDDGKLVISFAKEPFGGLMIHRVDNFRANKQITTNLVSDVEIIDGILHFNELEGGAMNTRMLNLNAYKEYLRK